MISIELNLEGFQDTTRFFDSAEKRIRSGLSGWAGAVGEHLRTRVQANAPVDTGALRESITVRIDNSIIAGPQVLRPPFLREARGATLTISSALSYAMRMHEGFFQLGPSSSMQASTPEGGVGRKFIERVLQTHITKYQTALAFALGKAFSSKQVNPIQIMGETRKQLGTTRF